MTTTFSVAMDWDGGGAWTDESAYVQRVRIRSGFDRAGDRVADGGRAVIVLDNSTGRFSPGNADSPLYGALVPRREVRVQASDGASTWTLFRGFVDSIEPDAGFWSQQRVTVTCVDAITLLRQQRVSVAHVDSMPVGDAVSSLVSDVYTPPATDINDNGDALHHYGRAWQPERTTALDALHDVAAAVYGRFFVARDGKVTFRTRDQLQDASVAEVVTVGEAFPLEYYENLQALQASDLIAHWPLWEASGGVFLDESGNGHTGVAHGWTWGQTGIGDGRSSVLLDGVNDYGDLSASGLEAAFNGSAGTLFAWVYLHSDTAFRVAVRLAADGSNFVQVHKPAADGYLAMRYRAGGTQHDVLTAVPTGTWLPVALTWSAAAGELKAYVNGAQVGSTQTGLGTWAGTLDYAMVGSFYQALNVWNGKLAHVALWAVPLTAAQIAVISEV